MSKHRYFVWNYKDGSPCVPVERDGIGAYLVPVELRGANEKELTNKGTLTPLILASPALVSALETLLEAADHYSVAPVNEAKKVMRALLDQLREGSEHVDTTDN